MWARGRVVTGLCPACGHENEDLAHLGWKCKAGQYAHIPEKAPQHTNVEEMHWTYRDMLLVQKDGQLLEWAKNNRNNEVATIAAAKEMRSRVESRRNRDEGRKISAGKAVQCLGEYFCDDRLQGRTDHASIHDGKR